MPAAMIRWLHPAQQKIDRLSLPVDVEQNLKNTSNTKFLRRIIPPVEIRDILYARIPQAVHF